MSVVSLIKGILRGTTDQERVVEIDKYGDLLVAQGMPSYAELTRQGDGWQAMNVVALAALVVRPSTVANFTLFNNEPEGGKSFVIDRAFAFNLVTTGAEARSGLWLCVHKKGLVSPTNDITARGSLRGKANYGGNAVCDTAMTVTNDGWFPWGQTTDVEPTGVLPGSILTVHVEGRIIVPPQCGVSTQVVSSVVDNTFTSGFAWYEKQLDIP